MAPLSRAAARRQAALDRRQAAMARRQAAAARRQAALDLAARQEKARRVPRFRTSTSSEHVRIQFLNLARGLGSTHRVAKAQGLARMAATCKYPDFIAYTELYGPAGSTDVRKWIGDAMNKEYSIVLWSQRSVAHDGHTAAGEGSGGGIALLVHKRLRVTAREMPISASVDERPLLDGHWRTWRFDPIPDPRAAGAARMKPIIITLAYFPPAGPEWGEAVRTLMTRVTADSDRDIAQLRLAEDIFAITLAHTNAPDGLLDVPLVDPAIESLTPTERQTAVERANAHPGAGVNRGKLDAADAAGGQVTLRRAFSVLQRRERSEPSPIGADLLADAAASGKCPLTGVMNHAQPTSWTKTGLTKGGGRCSNCSISREPKDPARPHRFAICRLVTNEIAARVRKNGFAGTSQPKTCSQRLALRSFHDVVWVPSELVFRALTAPSGGRDLIHAVTRRVLWAPRTPIDHAVTFVRLFVGRSQRDADAGAPVAAECARFPAPRRIRLPTDLLERDRLKRECTRMLNNRFSVLEAVPDELIEMNDAVCKELDAAATRLAMDGDRADLDQDTPSVARLRQVARQCYQAVVHFLQRRPPGKLARDVKKRRRTERKALNMQLLVAKQNLRHAERALADSQQCADRRHAPRAYWDRMRFFGTDPGAPLPLKSLILDHQTTDTGKLITAKREECKRNLRKNRADLYSIPALSERCKATVANALAHVHLENRSLANLHSTSAAAQSAAEPVSPNDSRRYGIPVAAARDAVVEAQEQRDRAALHDAVAVASLQAPVEVHEVVAACHLLTDVGPGTDGLPPAMLSMLDKGATAEAICALFNICLREGVLPTSWQEHRMMFLYKGKSSDPFHLGNYRGIAIDNMLLKLWSLLLCARLEGFLERTGGISTMQGGFRKLRGPPESVLALSETVRATSQNAIGHPGKNVELVFIDVKVAYDSVLHPVLWKRCLDKGIGGHFLAALQAVYHEASARVHVDGELLPGVPLQRGVLQGNPLSPSLFNVYIDGAIRDLSKLRVLPGGATPLGLWLPATSTSDPSQGSVDDYIQCLFFADDGVLMETDRANLQRLLNELIDGLDAIGLSINASKTKWMLVPHADVTAAQYEVLKEAAGQAPLKVKDEPVGLVDEFDYLGVRLWWRWNYTRAWKLAAERARKAYFAALSGGWQRRCGSLAAQLDFARAKIFSHFHYVAAVAGAAGQAANAAWHECDEVTGWVLRTISGLRHGNVTALKMEAGIWDDGMHIHMMVLRFWRKILTAPPESTFARAARLSVAAVSAYAASQPRTHRTEPANLHRQPWGQALFAAAKCFNLSIAQIRSGDPEALVTIQRASVDAAGANADAAIAPVAPPAPAVVAAANDASRLALLAWTDSRAGEPDEPNTLFRLIVKPAIPRQPNPAVVVHFEEGVNCWTLPEGTTREDALTTWTVQLQEAMYASIRERGNHTRAVTARAFLDSCGKPNNGRPDRLQVWAATLSGPWLQPYWHLYDAELAQWLLMARFDQCPTEDFVRTTGDPKKPNGRILDRHERACYLCPEIAPDTYWPETLVHVLLMCPHRAYQRRRVMLAAKLTALASSEPFRRLSNPDGIDFADKSVSFTILQLCTGVGSNYGSLLQQMPVAAHLAHAIDRRLSPQFVRDSDTAHKTIAWLRPLFQDWLTILRDPLRQEDPQTSPGSIIALLVARHVKGMFDLRHSSLASNQHGVKSAFLKRLRNPRGLAPQPAAAAANAGRAPDAPPPPPAPPPPVPPIPPDNDEPRPSSSSSAPRRSLRLSGRRNSAV